MMLSYATAFEREHIPLKRFPSPYTVGHHSSLCEKRARQRKGHRATAAARGDGDRAAASAHRRSRRSDSDWRLAAPSFGASPSVGRALGPEIRRQEDGLWLWYWRSRAGNGSAAGGRLGRLRGRLGVGHPDLQTRLLLQSAALASSR